MKGVTCIIQARRQSSRLPDKILLPLGGKPVLQHVIERCQKIAGVNQVVVARPAGAFEEAIDPITEAVGAVSFQGDMTDVLARYWGAHQMAPSDYVMRVTADCPLLDPVLCGELLAKMIAEDAEYCGLSGWPHGIECEIFTADLLKTTHEEATSSDDREHVTLWMKKQANIRKIGHAPEEQRFRLDNRWVVDYPEDYEFLKALFALFPGGQPPLRWYEILSVIDARPELRDINRACTEEWTAKTMKIYKASGQKWNPN